MKNTKKIFIFICFITLIISCEKQDNLAEVSNIAATTLLKTTSLSKFDTNDNIKLEFNTANEISVTKSQIDFKGNKADVTISKDTNEKQSGIFNSSIFGDLESVANSKKNHINFKLISTLSNGETMNQLFKIEISKHVLSIIKKQSISNLNYMNKTPDTLSFKTETNSAVISSVALNWKKNKSGTYASTTPTGKALNVKGDSIVFKNLNETTYGYGLKVKDTLYYQFIAASGTLKDTLEISIPINSQNFEKYATLNLYSDLEKNKLNLETGKTYADTDPKEKGEIKFMTPSGFEKSGVVSIDFVKVGDLSTEAKYLNTKEKFFSEKDLLAIKKIYDAGTKIAKVNSPAVDDLYVYKIDRIIEDENKNKKTVNYYGLIKIVNLKSVEANGTTTHSIGIESGEGVLK